MQPSLASKFPRLSWVFLGLCLATGCVQYHPHPISAVQTADEFDARKLTDPGLKAFFEANLQRELAVWPPPAWDLTHLTLAAFYFHADLEVARAKWAVAAAGQRTAAERLNPTLSVNPAYNSTMGVPSPWVVAPALDVPVETAGKRGHRMAQAAFLAEAARMNLAAAAWQVRSRVRRALVDFHLAREMETLLKEQQNLQAENLRLLQLQHAEGAISAFELTQARLAADASRLALRDTERQGAEARVQLAEAIGVPVQALDQGEWACPAPDSWPADSSAAEARRQALLHRADILGALAEYAAAQSALRLEIAKQYPDIHLSPGYEFDQGDNKWALGIGVTLPVFNHNQGAIAEAEARRTAAAATFNALQARVVAEIDQALAGGRMALRKQSDVEAMVADLAKQEKTAQTMLEAGEISKSELAALRLQLSVSALARLDAEGKSRQAWGLLEDALQVPLGIPEKAWLVSPRIPQSIQSHP